MVDGEPFLRYVITISNLADEAIYVFGYDAVHADLDVVAIETNIGGWGIWGREYGVEFVMGSGSLGVGETLEVTYLAALPVGLEATTICNAFMLSVQSENNVSHQYCFTMLDTDNDGAAVRWSVFVWGVFLTYA